MDVLGGRLLAVVGPSFAGKSTFIRFLLDERDDFTAASLLTTRQPRPGEVGDETMGFVDEHQMDRLVETGWFVDTVGPARYALDLAGAQALSRRRHVLLGVAPPTLPKLCQRLPELKVVLLWPADFDQMQAELAASSERPEAERADRIARNEALRVAPPFAHLRLNVARVPLKQRRDMHRALADDLATQLRTLPWPLAGH
ncbi:hypothetical protein AB0368_33630 [Actinoplanes sp. NPDC051475]|uniref:hypothetical protein n=1 Tax=Actinoplanes sp. NPDC051475 TaxID=3157225 RepID=UPI00344CEDE6